MYYDPPGRARRVVLPTGCLRKVTFTAWERAIHDENDTSADGDCTAGPAPVARANDRAVLQGPVHEHDPAGNVPAMANDADDSRHFDATAAGPDQSITCDAGYRLVEATGRGRASLGRPPPVSPPTPAPRYQLGNHLGRVSLELDECRKTSSYEEYHPDGTTAWQAPELATISLKRYRYTGMERDEESGLQCHGRRYYAPWLGRWLSADPIGTGDGVNRYAYVHGNPVGGRDETGLADSPPAPSLDELSRRFDVVFLAEDEAVGALARELRVGKNIADDREPALRAEVAQRGQGAAFSAGDARAAERALALVDPFRPRSTTLDEGTRRTPLSIGRLAERSIVAGSIAVVGGPITRGQLEDETAAGLALRQEDTILIFDAAHGGGIDRRFMGKDTQRQLLGVYVHELVHATIMKDLPLLTREFRMRFGDQHAVSAYGERTRRAGGGPDDFIESDEPVVEALKQFLVDPRKFAARHGEMAQFLGEQLGARYGAGQPTEEFVAGVYQRAGQRPP